MNLILPMKKYYQKN